MWGENDMIMLRAACTIVSAVFLLTVAAETTAQTYSVLHNFTGPPGGSLPNGSLTLSGSMLYGMTSDGGSNNYYGMVFQINTNGTGYTNLHSFSGGNTDGSGPNGSLILSGSTLYGMTSAGGSSYGKGTLFKISTNGSGYVILHSFTGVGGDGSEPYGSLTLSGTNLFGMTYSGGSNAAGTVFKINTDGSGYTNLHVFSGYPDGAGPYGSLTLSGSTLYGTTYAGGNNYFGGFGTAFKINTDGSGYSILHYFSAAQDDGENPRGSLTLSGSTLYGMTYDGGGAHGTVFKIETNSAGFAVLYGFGLAAGDGYYPYGSLTLSGSTLYGMTSEGGSGGGSGYGTVFQINTDGTGYQILHNFMGSPSDGIFPYDAVTLSGSTLFGMANQGGNFSSTYGYGIIFSLDLPVFCITGIALEGNDILITWTSGAGTTNALQAATGPGYATSNFVDIFAVTNTVGSVTSYLDAGAVTGFSSRYYRVRLVP